MTIPSMPRFGQRSETHASHRAGQPGFRMWGQPSSGRARSYGLGGRASHPATGAAGASMSQQLRAMFAGCRFPNIAAAAAPLIQEQEEFERRAAQAQNGQAAASSPARPSTPTRPLSDRSAHPLPVSRSAPSAKKPVPPSQTITAEEIAANLDLLKKAVAAGKAATIDREFIKIFSNDIKLLASANGVSEGKIAELKSSLREVGAELYMAQVIRSKNKAPQVSTSQASSSQPSEDARPLDIRPLIERRTSLKKFAERFSDGSVERKGFELLNDEYRMHHVRGDGHCLFRSFGFSYVNSWLEMTPAVRALEVEHLDETVAALEIPALAAKYAAFKEVLAQAAKKPDTTAESIIACPAASDAIVAFLRAASSAYNERNGNDTFNAEMQRKGTTARQYLDDMADMSKAQNGGHLELHAISKLFSANIRIFDPTQIGQDGEVRPDSTIRYQDHVGQDEHFLIYRKAPANHFDVAIPTPKIEVVGENPDVD